MRPLTLGVVSIGVALAVLALVTVAVPAAPAAPKGTAAAVYATAQATPVNLQFTPRTLLDVTGSGIKTTETFTVGRQWDMAWHYNCAAFGGRGNFIVTVLTASGGLSSNAGTNQLGAGGDSVEHFHIAGTYYLEMNSECSWHVTVTG